MDDQRDIVAAGSAGTGSPDTMEYQNLRSGTPHEDIETDSEAEQEGPDAEWKFWDEQLTAALNQERRFRVEGDEAEILYFGPDDDPGVKSSQQRGAIGDPNKITDKTALIQSNIEVLKPLIFSETPQPIVRRRFRGDGRIDETDVMAAEAGQRLATYLVETEDFDSVMENVRDDWLIAGRGAGRVIYEATVTNSEMTLPDGTVMEFPVKTMERVQVRYVAWRRLIIAATDAWHQAPWLAIETPMTRTKVKKRFGEDIANAIVYNQKGLVGQSRGIGDEDRRSEDSVVQQSESGEVAINPFDTCTVFEIWNKEEGYVVWWCNTYKDGVLDREDDPLGLEDFWPMPKPLLAVTKGETLNPRPSIKYYQQRAEEIDKASAKLKTILDAVSVSGLFPGEMDAEVKKLLDGKNTMIGISSWISLMEKGGSKDIIQWLPLNHMVAAIQALVTLREQAKQAMFEASGVSDIMRAQGDPDETATAQNLKGKFAGMRLSDKQRKMAIYARDMLRLMVEVGLEHFDTKTLADITGLDLPMTELQRQAMVAEQDAAKAQFQQAAALHQQYAQAVEAGQMPGPIPPAPEEPKFDRIPETSWELVHERLRSDYKRKISVAIETQSTILADEESDKNARVEFLSAFAKFVAELGPMVNTGQFDPKTMKELLMFGIRGFPKSRTLEGLIAALPDEPQGQPPEDTQVTVAKIKAQVDADIEKMRQENNNKEREHERQMKGVEFMAEAAKTAGEVENA